MSGRGAMSETGHRLMLVGAGVMGVGIAALAVGRGIPVVLVDVDPARLAAAPQQVRAQLRGAQLLGKLPAGGRRGDLRTSTDLGDARHATAVIEAVPEQAALKAEVLAEVSAAAPADTLLATNTSAIPVAELAAAVDGPERLLGTHFMNPPYLVETVEVIRGPATGDAAMASVAELLTALDRRSVVVGDGPGFVSNHILMRMINDAVRLVAEGRAGPGAVDEVFTGCLGHRMGPLATADLIGLDNVLDTLTVLYERTGDVAYEPAELLVRTVAAGHYGRKTGHGLHEYNP